MKGKINETKIFVIPCCADLNHFSNDNCNPSKIIQFQNKYKELEDKFVLSYVGSLGTWYMADEMMEFFKILSVFSCLNN